VVTPLASKQGAPDIQGNVPTGLSGAAPLKLLSFSTEELGQIAYADAVQRLAALSRLPSLIRSSRSDRPLETEALQVLLEGVPRATQAAIVQLLPDAAIDAPRIRVVQALQRLGLTALPRPDADLIYDAVRCQRKSMTQSGSSPVAPWIICVPLPDDPEPDNALYLIGHADAASADAEADLRGDLKFVKLVADTYGALLLVQDLQQRQALLSRFLTRPVLAALASQERERALTPRQVLVTVMFCDLHDSCHFTEQAPGDLGALCERMMDALSIMTEKIVHEEGVISDFQGDAALGFWGWPFEQADQVERAARAALAIHREFQHAARRASSPLFRLQCSIGVAHGQAIAGKIGSADQFKIGVFGPVVNLAARLESLTRRFHVPVLLDAAAAARLGAPLLRRWCRLRRVARVQPHGLVQRVDLHELLPPRFDPTVLAESARLDYESALDAFQKRNWQDARERLGELPADGPSRLLCEFMARHGDTPPDDWDGTIAFDEK
jgi:adenylate cyclase